MLLPHLLQLCRGDALRGRQEGLVAGAVGRAANNHNRGVLLEKRLQCRDHNNMALVAHYLWDYLEPEQSYREHLDELGNESIDIHKQIKPAGLCFLHRLPIEGVIIEVLGKLDEEEAQEIGLVSGDEVESRRARGAKAAAPESSMNGPSLQISPSTVQ